MSVTSWLWLEIMILHLDYSSLADCDIYRLYLSRQTIVAGFYVLPVVARVSVHPHLVSGR